MTNSAVNQVRQAEGGRLLDRLARLGLICRAVLYVLIGALALQIALGDGSEEADSSGAIETLADQPFGTVTLWLMLVGFAALALWQLTEAMVGTDGLGARITAAARTGLYGLLAASLAALLFGGDEIESSDQQARDLTAMVLDLPGGQLLLGVIGLGVFGLGCYWLYKGVMRRFFRDLHAEQISPRTRSVVAILGLVGYAARGVVAGLAGVFLVQAAIQYEPDEAKGVDATLRSFADTTVGPWLLVVIAVGLLLFAAYCMCEARWRRV
jgi:hypothetical protein